MPQLLVAGLASFGPLGTPLVGTVFGAGGFFTTAFGSFLGRAAMGYALNALTPKPSLGGGGGGYTVNTLAPDAPAALIYGEVKVGGVVFYQESTSSNNLLHRCVAFAGHEIESFESIYLNDEELTIDGSGNVTAPAKYVGLVRILEHLGADDQAADTTLISESANWTTEHRAKGVAYLYVRFEASQEAYPNGIPILTALVRGKKVYDPRDTTTAWSANSALCLRDYLITSGTATSATVNDTLFSAAANTCDESVSLDGGGTESRYSCNGAVTADVARKDILGAILSSMGGMLWYSQGTWGCKAAEYTAPVLALSEDDLRSGLNISTRNSRRDGFNKVTGRFAGSETNWQQTNYPELTSTTFLSEDNEVENALDLDLPFTTSSPTAQRIAKIALYRNREQLRISGSFGLRALELTVGDLVTITNARLGFSAKVFEVVEWSFGMSGGMTLECTMTLQEISSGVFDWDADETAFASNNTTLASPFDVPDVGITLSQVLRVINEQVVNVLVADITCADSGRLDRVELSYKASADSTWIKGGSGDIGQFDILDLEVGDYDIRAVGVNSLGLRGDYATSSDYPFEPAKGPPEDVTYFAKQISTGTLFLSWTAVGDLDLSYYQVRYSPATTGATWGAATPLITKIARPGTGAAVPVRTGTYLIKAFDKTGEQSANADTVTVESGEIPSFGTTDTVTEDPTFSGSKTNVAVDTAPTPDELLMSSYTGSSNSGTYYFTTVTGEACIDTTTSRTTTVNSAVVYTRHDSNAIAGEILWSEIPGNFSTWPGLFSTWTDEDAAFGDYEVLVYVAATPDDPTGTPTWGSWQLANGGEVVGRAFKFKAELTSSNPDITPAISALSASVSY